MLTAENGKLRGDKLIAVEKAVDASTAPHLTRMDFGQAL
jgi:hypothetical protein